HFVEQYSARPNCVLWVNAEPHPLHLRFGPCVVNRARAFFLCSWLSFETYLFMCFLLCADSCNFSIASGAGPPGTSTPCNARSLSLRDKSEDTYPVLMLKPAALLKSSAVMP